MVRFWITVHNQYLFHWSPLICYIASYYIFNHVSTANTSAFTAGTNKYVELVHINQFDSQLFCINEKLLCISSKNGNTQTAATNMMKVMQIYLTPHEILNRIQLSEVNKTLIIWLRMIPQLHIIAIFAKSIKHRIRIFIGILQIK